MKPERVQPPQAIHQTKTVVERTYEFRNFSEALAFVNVVARTAKDLELYPEIGVRGSAVTLCMISTNASDLDAIETQVAQSYEPAA